MDKKQVINVANSFSYLASRRSKLERILAPYLVLCLDMRFFCHFDTISYGLFIVKKLTDLVTLAKVIHMGEIFWGLAPICLDATPPGLALYAAEALDPIERGMLGREIGMGRSRRR